MDEEGRLALPGREQPHLSPLLRSTQLFLFTLSKKRVGKTKSCLLLCLPRKHANPLYLSLSSEGCIMERDAEDVLTACWQGKVKKTGLRWIDVTQSRSRTMSACRA